MTDDKTEARFTVFVTDVGTVRGYNGMVEIEGVALTDLPLIGFEAGDLVSFIVTPDLADKYRIDDAFVVPLIAEEAELTLRPGAGSLTYPQGGEPEKVGQLVIDDTLSFTKAQMALLARQLFGTGMAGPKPENSRKKYIMPIDDRVLTYPADPLRGLKHYLKTFGQSPEEPKAKPMRPPRKIGKPRTLHTRNQRHGR